MSLWLVGRDLRVGDRVDGYFVVGVKRAPRVSVRLRNGVARQRNALGGYPPMELEPEEEVTWAQLGGPQMELPGVS